jgi:anthranilate phosphoribosyltransferase
VILLNSGAALCVSGVADSVARGMQLAAESIDSGKAQEKLELLIQLSSKGS